jgi:hypothetical protein
VLLWDVPQTRLLHLWAELAGGGEAMRALGTDPAKAVPFLKERLARAPAAESKAVRLVAALGAEQFAAREKASHELERLGPEAELALRVALEEDPSPEVRQRAERLLALLQKPQKDNPPFDPRAGGDDGDASGRPGPGPSPPARQDPLNSSTELRSAVSLKTFRILCCPRREALRFG